MTDDELRADYAAHLRRAGAEAAPAGAACVSPEALLALVRREGPEEERLATLDHAMACARCRAELDLLRAIEAAGDAVEGEGSDEASNEASGSPAPRETAPAVRVLRPSPASHARRWWPGAAGLALAASIALVVGIARRHVGGDGTDQDPGTVRSPADAVTLLAPADGEALPAGAPLRFAWRPVPGATRYTVEVLATDGAVALAGTTADTVFQPTDARRLTAGQAYRWWVSAVTDGGGAPRRSALRALRVAAP